MLDSGTLKYEPYTDSRVRTAKGFSVGQSGALLLGVAQTGEKYMIKHTYPNNAANEYAGCWLAGKMGVPAPKAQLLTPNKRFRCEYAVAIEYLDDLKPFAFEELTDQQKHDVLGHVAGALYQKYGYGTDEYVSRQGCII